MVVLGMPKPLANSDSVSAFLKSLVSFLRSSFLILDTIIIHKRIKVKLFLSGTGYPYLLQ